MMKSGSEWSLKAEVQQEWDFENLTVQQLNFQTVFATTTITTVFNCYNESNGVAFEWI